MDNEILTVTPILWLKLLVPIAVVFSFVVSFLSGEIPLDNLPSVAAVFGVFFIISLIYFWRMNSYYATIFPDRLVVKNFWGKKELPFQGLTAMGNIVTTAVSGGNPVWIRSFDMVYQQKTIKVRIAGLGYKAGLQLIQTMQQSLQTSS